MLQIAQLPKGTFASEIWSDGYEEPVRLVARMNIRDDEIEVDFAGTSGLSSRGINVPPAYCRAYSCFGIKCVVAPEIPNNWASLAPFRMTIPEGCILNAPHPYPVSVRHVIGHLLPDLMMGCLHQAVPDRVTAEGASALWNPPLREQNTKLNEDRQRGGGGGPVGRNKTEAAVSVDGERGAARFRAVRGGLVARLGWWGPPDAFTALDRLGKAYLEFARAEPAFYSAMFEAGVPAGSDSPLARSRGTRLRCVAPRR